MMWIAVAVVALLLLGLAWRSSRRARPVHIHRQPVDSYTAQAQDDAALRHNYGSWNAMF